MFKYNPEQQQQQPPPPQQQLMAPPRMSFSSDFALEPPPPRPRMSCFSGDFADADANFEFSPAGGSRPMGMMMDADQLFSKGRILPLREAAARQPPTTTTLRDELRAPPDADRARCGPPRWKELLGLKHRAAHQRKGAGGAAAASAADAHVDFGGEHGEAGE